jgi:hypothetical protein
VLCSKRNNNDILGPYHAGSSARDNRRDKTVIRCRLPLRTDASYLRIIPQAVRSDITLRTAATTKYVLHITAFECANVIHKIFYPHARLLLLLLFIVDRPSPLELVRDRCSGRRGMTREVPWRTHFMRLFSFVFFFFHFPVKQSCSPLEARFSRSVVGCCCCCFFCDYRMVVFL